MVKTRHDAVPEIGFAPAAGTPPGIEVVSLEELHNRARSEKLGRLQRPAFHHLVALHSGELTHTADFTEYHMPPGSWLWTRPGQVQRWSARDHAEGTVVMFEGRFVDGATQRLAGVDDVYASVVRVPAPAEADVLTAALRVLQHEFDTPISSRPLQVRTVALRHALSIVLLRLAHLDPAAPVDGVVDSAFLRFRAAVEREFAHNRNVADYAFNLGYSPRTLSRVTEQAVGMAAKQFIDRRVVLEAQRLLAHTDRPANGIATDLGFSSATNFTKFFHKHTGCTPLEFRRHARADV
jgi:AraC-like DNA-binding protein